MAPEQHAGEAVDARTDQWALACALYGALYDQRPFAGDTMDALADSVQRVPEFVAAVATVLQATADALGA